MSATIWAFPHQGWPGHSIYWVLTLTTAEGNTKPSNLATFFLAVSWPAGWIHWTPPPSQQVGAEEGMRLHWNDHFLWIWIHIPCLQYLCWCLYWTFRRPYPLSYSTGQVFQSGNSFYNAGSVVMTLYPWNPLVLPYTLSLQIVASTS